MPQEPGSTFSPGVATLVPAQWVVLFNTPGTFGAAGCMGLALKDFHCFDVCRFISLAGIVLELADVIAWQWSDCRAPDCC